MLSVFIVNYFPTVKNYFMKQLIFLLIFMMNITYNFYKVFLICETASHHRMPGFSTSACQIAICKIFQD